MIHYYYLMFLKTLEKCVHKFINYTPQSFFEPRINLACRFKNVSVLLELILELLLLMVEKSIGDRICHFGNRYAKADNKYIKDYNKNKESSYFKYWK